MDSLTPDKDDLERFRQDRTKASPAKPATGSRGAAQDTPPPAAVARKVVAQSSGSSAWLTALVLVLVVAVAAVSFWQIFRQQATINQLQAELGEASQYINQSKLVTARLEGSLSETEANVAQSGSQLASRLNAMDSEIRKLWDVSNKRNIELIKESQSKITALEAANTKLQARLQTSEQVVGEQKSRADSLQQTLESLKGAIAKVEREAAALAKADVVERVESLAKNNQAQLTAVTKRVEAVASQGAGQQVDGRVKNLETAIESIDANRQQLNRRVLDLERRLNEAQLRLNALQGTGG